MQLTKCRRFYFIGGFCAREYLRRRQYSEVVEYPITPLATQLIHNSTTHAGTTAPTNGVENLEALKVIAALGFLANDVKDRVHHF